MKLMNYSPIRTTCALVIGLMLVLWPDAAINYIVTTISISFLISGFIVLIGYFGTKSESGVSRRFSIEGAGSLLFGLWLVTIPGSPADVLMPLLNFILIIGDVRQTAPLSMTRRWMPIPGGFYVILALILIAGIITLFNPTGICNAALVTIGISNLVYVISEPVDWLEFARHRPKTPVRGEIEDTEIIE